MVNGPKIPLINGFWQAINFNGKLMAINGELMENEWPLKILIEKFPDIVTKNVVRFKKNHLGRFSHVFTPIGAH